MSIGVALIGYGLGGRAFHAPFVAANPDMVLRAVVSRDAAKVHRDHPEVTVCADVASVLALPGIDLVVVSSPDHLHADHAIAALDSGRHVVIDKPLAPTLCEARAIGDSALRAGRLAVPFQNRRWDADFLTLRALIASGRLGRIVHFQSRFDRWRPEPAPVWKEARAAGSWQDLGPHLVDQALCLFDMPEAVTADLATLRPGAPGPDWFDVTLHYPGLRATLHSSKLAADHGLRLAVHGTGGSWIKHGLDVQEEAAVKGAVPGSAGWGIDPRAGLFTDGSGRSTPIDNVPGDYRRFWTALADAILTNAAPPVTMDEGLATMTVLEAARISSAEGRTIRLA